MAETSNDAPSREGAASRLELLDGESWQAFVAAPLAVLVLGKTDCPACREWGDALTARLGDDPTFWPDVRFGKMLLDRPGLASFKRANTWLASLDVLPYTVIYSHGEKVKEFVGGGLPRLEGRLEALTA